MQIHFPKIPAADFEYEGKKIPLRLTRQWIAAIICTMRYDPQIHHRRSIRLKGYDYSQPSAYFVTIVVKDHDCLFGDVIDGEMKLSRAGEIVDEFWKQIPNHFSNVVLEEFMVMPNHLHAIVFITENVGAGSPRPYKPTLG